ncbi:hypothetical protein IJ750_02995 [bacterium]|nr:hypothetical protein [bacterium]
MQISANNHTQFKGIFGQMNIKQSFSNNRTDCYITRYYYPFVDETEDNIVNNKKRLSYTKTFYPCDTGKETFVEHSRIIVGEKLPFTRANWRKYVSMKNKKDNFFVRFIEDALNIYNLAHRIKK